MLKHFSRTLVTTLGRNKAALVTGGGQGLGEAICRRLAKDGYTVAVCDINSAGDALATEIGGVFIQANVTDPKQVEEAVQKVVDNFGSLDALVNCAGIVGKQVPMGEGDVEDWKQVIDVNLFGTMYGMKFGLAQMAKQSTGGSIVNMSSTAGFRGIVNICPCEFQHIRI